MENNKDITYSKTYSDGWKDGFANNTNNTPITAGALNQIENALKHVYDAVGSIHTIDANEAPTQIIDLEDTIQQYKFSVQSEITQLKKKPVVTYTTTDSDYETAEEFLIVCGNAQPYIIEEE